MASLSTVSLLLTAAAWCASANVIVPDPTANISSSSSSLASITDGITATPDTTSTSKIQLPQSSPPTIMVYNSTSTGTNSISVSSTDDTRDSRFLSFSMGSTDSAAAAATNTLQEKQDEIVTDPSAHLVDIYTDCLMQLSFPCVQRKLLLFLDKLGRMKGERLR